MRWKDKSAKQKKPPDKLSQIREALAGGEKSSKKILRAFDTLLRQEEPEQPESKPRRKN